MPQRTRTGHMFMYAAGLLAAAAVIGASVSSFSANTGLKVPMGVNAPTGEDVAMALHRAGLGPEHLAAAGVADSQAAILIDQAVSHFDVSRKAALTAADAEVRLASKRLADKRREVRAGQAESSELSSIQAELDTATAASAAVIGGLFDAATSGLESEAIDAIALLKANSDRSVPVEYRVVDQTDGEWLALRNALANIDQAARSDRIDEDAACAQLVASCDADADVTAARNGLQANLNSIRARFIALAGG